MNALKFFCFSGEEQVTSLRNINMGVQPVFFSKQSEDEKGCDYFIGVACVFISHGMELVDEYVDAEEIEKKAEHFLDFRHLLNVMMVTEDAARWAPKSVLEDERWERLRAYARKALNERGESLPSEPPTFNVAELIDPDDFRTTEEARRLLE